MRGRRYCEASPSGVHRAFYSARMSPEITTAPCRDCGVIVVKDVDGAWFEPLLATAWSWGFAFVIIALVIGYAVALAWANA